MENCVDLEIIGGNLSKPCMKVLITHKIALYARSMVAVTIYHCRLQDFWNAVVYFFFVDLTVSVLFKQIYWVGRDLLREYEVKSIYHREIKRLKTVKSII